MEKMPIDLLLSLNSKAKGVISVTSGDTVMTAAKVLKKQNVGLLVVIDQEKLVGVISERDIVQRWVATDKFSNAVLVKDIMSKPVEVITSEDTIFDCYLRFVARNCRHLPIIDPMGTVIGVLSLRDVAHYVVGELSQKKKIKSTLKKKTKKRKLSKRG